jgi:hypothetical protein
MLIIAQARAAADRRVARITAAEGQADRAEQEITGERVRSDALRSRLTRCRRSSPPGSASADQLAETAGPCLFMSNVASTRPYSGASSRRLQLVESDGGRSMPKSRRRVPKPARAPSALWRTQQALLDVWLQDSPQGQQLLRDRTLAEAREAVRELLARGLLDMQVIDLRAIRCGSKSGRHRWRSLAAQTPGVDQVRPHRGNRRQQSASAAGGCRTARGNDIRPDHGRPGARRPRRAAWVRCLHGEAAQRPHRAQSAHRRSGIGGREDGAVLQGRQGTALPAQSRWDEAEPRCHDCACAGRRGLSIRAPDATALASLRNGRRITTASPRLCWSPRRRCGRCGTPGRDPTGHASSERRSGSG